MPAESAPLLNRGPWTWTQEPFRPKSIKLLLLLFAVAALFWIPGCVSTVTPPENPADPVTVYLAASACHAGVVLPHPGGGMIEYAYGDWDWYALNHDRWYHALDTVLWPTQGALGRRRLKTRDRTGLAAYFPSDRLRPFLASRERAAGLVEELEERFRQHTDRMVHNERFGLSFVPDDRGYWFMANCNDRAAGWLRKLGCSVSWVPIRLGLTLDPR